MNTITTTEATPIYAVVSRNRTNSESAVEAISYDLRRLLQLRDALAPCGGRYSYRVVAVRRKSLAARMSAGDIMHDGYCYTLGRALDYGDLPDGD